MKLFLKIIFVIAVLGLLALTWMHNQSSVSLELPPVLKNTIKQPAAIMYIGFFAVGFLTGIVLSGGGKKGASGGGSAKSAKPKLIK